MGGGEKANRQTEAIAQVEWSVVADLEALRPLVSLRALSADVDEHEGLSVDVDLELRHAARRLSREQHVLCGRQVRLQQRSHRAPLLMGFEYMYMQTCTNGETCIRICILCSVI